MKFLEGAVPTDPNYLLKARVVMGLWFLGYVTLSPSLSPDPALLPPPPLPAREERFW